MYFVRDCESIETNCLFCLSSRLRSSLDRADMCSRVLSKTAARALCVAFSLQMAPLKGAQYSFYQKDLISCARKENNETILTLLDILTHNLLAPWLDFPGRQSVPPSSNMSRLIRIYKQNV